MAFVVRVLVLECVCPFFSYTRIALVVGCVLGFWCARAAERRYLPVLGERCYEPSASLGLKGARSTHRVHETCAYPAGHAEACRYIFLSNSSFVKRKNNDEQNIVI